MALTFFWRCEGTTLDGTHDFSAGDTTATASGAPALDAGAARVGSTGILINSTSEAYLFNPASIWSLTVGSFGFWLRVTNWVNGHTLLKCFGTAANDRILLALGTTDELNLHIRRAGGAQSNMATTAANLATGTWYFVLARYNQPANDRRIEVYNTDLSLKHATEDLATAYDAPAAFDNTAGFQHGNVDGGTACTYHMDNIFVSQVYAEPIQNFMDISSYTLYGAIPGLTRPTFAQMQAVQRAANF